MIDAMDVFLFPDIYEDLYRAQNEYFARLAKAQEERLMEQMLQRAVDSGSAFEITNGQPLPELQCILLLCYRRNRHRSLHRVLSRIDSTREETGCLEMQRLLGSDVLATPGSHNQ